MDNFSLAKVRNMLPFSQQPEPSMSSTEHTSAEDRPNEQTEEKPLPPRPDSPITVEPRPLTPEEQKPKSNLDLINECDSFPYHETHPELYLQQTSLYYHLRVALYPDVTLGYILPSVAEIFRGLPDWSLDDEERTLTLTGGNDEPSRSAIVAATTAALRQTGHFVVLKGWRDELYPVYGPNKDLLFSLERSASPLFGVVTYGCHMTAYTISKKPRTQKDNNVQGESGDQDTEPVPEPEAEEEEDEEEMRIWVPRRSRTKQTYGGMLDNTVAGGLATGEDAFEGLVREASEEASLPAALVRRKAKAVGSVTYFHIRDHRAGGETKLLMPEIQYVFDLELPADVVPKPSDDEVEEFYLWGVDEVQEALRKGEFKPNCAVVLLDFFVRHGILSQKGEDDYLEIVSRLHRRMEFPTK